MKSQYLHRVIESFYLWLDYTLVAAEGFSNVEAKFFPQKGRIEGMNYLSSSFGQFVGDSSISGVHIPTAIKVNGVDTPLSNDLKLSYVNGGIYSKNIINNVVANVSVKDFNVYVSNESQSMVFLRKIEDGEDIYKPNTGAQLNSVLAPCVLISPTPMSNKPFAFGGTRMSSITINCVFISDNYYNIIGAGSVLADTVDKCIVNLDFGNDSPYDIFGGLKNPPYSYPNLINKGDYNRNLMIKEVETKPITSRENKNLKTSFISLVNFTLEDVRL